MHKRLLLLLVILTLLLPRPVGAQGGGAIYIVQPGDTLSSIADRFGVTLDDLMAANSIVNANLLAVGQQLIIPGLEGVSGILDTQVIGFGDSLRSLVRRTQMPLPLLRKLNRLVSPSELYVGASLIVPDEEAGGMTAHTTLRPGESLLEASIRQGSDPWTMASLNGLASTWETVPGDSLYSPTGASDPSIGGLPPAFQQVEVKALPLKQGGTGEIIVKAADGVTLGGVLVDHPLHFFPLGNGQQVALQGVHALLEPGVYPLRLDATLTDGSTQSYEQMVLVVSGGYGQEALSVDPVTIDPAVTEPENQQILSLVTPVTDQRFWQEPFRLPVPEDARGCIKGWFGMRRDYNVGSYFGFHAGVDYGICSETKPFDIYAPAPGKVVFVGKLTVRGNATVIDHGWGIYSGFWHQEETYVSVGELVGAGQLIGKIGGTGRVTGPHLHWEVWVNGIQVDPLDWLDASIP